MTAADATQHTDTAPSLKRTNMNTVRKRADCSPVSDLTAVERCEHAEGAINMRNDSSEKDLLLSGQTMAVVCAPPYTVPADTPPHTSILEGRYRSWEVLPNMRLGTFAHYRDNGQKAFASQNGGFLCHHGECPGTIRSWIFHEKKYPNKVRWSTCDCTRTDGLQGKVKMDRLPPLPPSYFELMKGASTGHAAVGGEIDNGLLQTPLRCDSGPITLSEDGRFFCGHGNEFVIYEMPVHRIKTPSSSICKKSIRRRFEIGGCGCKLVLPNRSSFPELPLSHTRRDSM